MSSKQRKQQETGRRQPTSQQPRKFPLSWIIAGVLTVLLIATIVLTLESDESDDKPDEYGTPTAEGSLSTLIDPLSDPAIGQPVPTIEGQDFDGSAVSIADDGRAKVILFLAHWCPVCQNEVPWVTDWLAQGSLPESVDFYTVATAIDRSRENWPPSEWLDREGWTPPVIVDDRVSSAATAFGLPAYPYWVFVDSDGNLAGRMSGSLNPTDLGRVVDTLAGS